MESAVISSVPENSIAGDTGNLPPDVWTVSASTAAGLTRAVERDALFLSTSQSPFLDLVQEVQTRRRHQSHRVAIVAHDAASATEKLKAVASGKKAAGVFKGQIPADAQPVAFVFSGLGTQWPGMGRDLYRTNSTFRATCEELDAIMAPIWEHRLIEEILRGDESVFEAERGQPLMFAVQVGLGRMYLEAGISPVLFTGHSLGEVAAAHFSGALSLCEATRVIIACAKALELTKGSGGMTAVRISPAEAEELISRYPDWLSVAAINSDSELTLAGSRESIAAVVDELTNQQRFAWALPFSYAFHSQAVEPIRDLFLAKANGLQAIRPRHPFVSALLGREVRSEILNEHYWWRNLRFPVKFSTAIRRAQEMGANVFLEVGPHPGLVRYLKQLTCDSPNSLALRSLRRNKPGEHCFAESLAAMHVAGVNLDWKQSKRAHTAAANWSDLPELNARAEGTNDIWQDHQNEQFPSREFTHIHVCSIADQSRENVTFDAAAVVHLPDHLNGDAFADPTLTAVFGDVPYLSNVYELPTGKIGLIRLPVRGRELFHCDKVPDLFRKAADIAHRCGATCLSLTGMIPAATDNGRDVVNWIGPASLQVTTGQATTTAAVIMNLRSLLQQANRVLESEQLAVLGLDAISRGCLKLALDVLPHPMSLTLCDIHDRKEELESLARSLKDEDNFDGPIRVLTFDRTLPDAIYKATTILMAFGMPEVIDIDRLQSGTIIIDDSNPPGFSLEQAIRRTEWEGDLFFSNAGITRHQVPIKQTVYIPAGMESVLAQCNFQQLPNEFSRDPYELSGSVLSSLLTSQFEDFQATVGLADLMDLRSHYHGLQRRGIGPSRPQFGTYFISDDVINQFRYRCAELSFSADSQSV